MKQSLLTITLFLTIFNLIRGQSSWADETFYKNCEKGNAVWDTVTFKNKVFKYSFIEKSYEHTAQNGQHFFRGTILLNLDSQKIDSLFLDQLFSVISDKIKLDKFTAFRTCEALQLYISAMGARTQKQKDYLKDNFIGNYDKSKGRK